MPIIRRGRPAPAPSVICPVCKNPRAVHYILGSLCQHLECDWASCLPCGTTLSRRDGRAIRSGTVSR